MKSGVALRWDFGQLSQELSGGHFISVILSRGGFGCEREAKPACRRQGSPSENRGFEFKGLRTGDACLPSAGKPDGSQASARNGPQHDGIV